MTNVIKRGGLKRVFSLAAIALVGLTLTACASTSINSNIQAAASQPTPPALNDPAAAVFPWKADSINFLVRIHNGFDENWKLLNDGPATYKEMSGVTQISGRCAADIQAALRNTTRLEMRRAIQTGGYQGLGALLGVAGGFVNPTSATFKQVGMLTLGTAFGGGFDAIDNQIALTLSAGHAQCVRDSVDRTNELNRIIIVMMPMLSFKPPVVLPPTTKNEEPTPDELNALNSVNSYQGEPAKPKKK